MGMFDSVFINPDKLPVDSATRKLPTGREFQTQSLDKILSYFYITDDGFLETDHIGFWGDSPAQKTLQVDRCNWNSEFLCGC